MTSRYDPRRKRHSDCTSKQRYRDHAEAVRARQNYQRKRGDPLRAYECPHCHGFHLTRLV